MKDEFSDGRMSVIDINTMRIPGWSRQQTMIGTGGVSCSIDGTRRGGMISDLDRPTWRQEIVQKPESSSSQTSSGSHSFFSAQIESIRFLILTLHSGTLAVPPGHGCVLPDRLHVGASAGRMHNLHLQRSALESRVPSPSTLTSTPADLQDNRQAEQLQSLTQAGLQSATCHTNLKHEAE